MTSYQINLIKSSWKAVSEMDPVTVGGLFYNRVFEIAPAARSMFRQPMEEQSKKLLTTLSFIINKLDKLDDIVNEVIKLANRHVDYGVRPEHYAIVGTALLWTLEQGLGTNWNDELKQAWEEC